jgi:hypothetical protein
MLNVRGLTLRTSDQKVINGLEALGVNTFGATAGKPFHLDLAGRPLVDYDLTLGSVDKATVGNLMSLTVLSKILNGMVKGDPSGFTAEQVAELKAHYLTPALYFSPPTTTPYAKLEDALAKGEVDTKLSYKVDFGTPDITSVGKLRSGNEYLQRRFTLTANGKEIEKPTLDYIAVPGVVWGVKKLTARTTLDSVDALSYPIYEGLLGLGKGDELKALLKTVGCVDPDKFLADIRGANSSTYVKEAVKFVDDAIEAVYEVLRPMVFYIGATGLVPDQLSAKTVSADDFVKAYPNAKLSKAEKEEGVFAVTPGGVALTVYVKGEHFSTQN